MSYQQLIQGCQRFDRAAQRKLFEEFYSTMMGIASRYAKNKAQAKEMLPLCFSGICAEIIEIKKDHNLDNWVRRKMIQKCVGYLRARRQEYFITSTVHLIEEEKKVGYDLFHQNLDPDPANITPTQYLEAIQLLPPSFRAVYNLFVIDQFTMDEISELLEISGETCRYNLTKAKEVLFKNIQHLQYAA